MDLLARSGVGTVAVSVVFSGAGIVEDDLEIAKTGAAQLKDPQVIFAAGDNPP